MSLGEMANVSREERDKFYREVENYHPTNTESAFRLPRVQWIHQVNARRPFKRVLDLCCNDGFSTRFLLDSPFLESLVGIDLNTLAIQGAKELKRDHHFPELASYYAASVFDFSYTNEFDTVVCFESLEHFEEQDARKLLRTIDSALETGGRAFMSTPHVDGIWGKTNPDPTHIFLLSDSEVAELMEDELSVSVEPKIWADVIHWSWMCD